MEGDTEVAESPNLESLASSVFGMGGAAGGLQDFVSPSQQAQGKGLPHSSLWDKPHAKNPLMSVSPRRGHVHPFL